MVKGYGDRPQGLDALNATMRGLQRQIDALRSKHGGTSVIREGDTIIVRDGGSFRFDDSASDIDPADVIYLDGPPTHYFSTGTNTYVDYATMLATAGTDWADAVSSLAFDHGALSVPLLDVKPDDYPATDDWLPAWLVPTEGRSCRVLIDDCVLDPSAFDAGGVSNYSAFLWADYDLADGGLTDTAFVDEFLYFHQYQDAIDGTGAYKRQWNEHVSMFSDYPAEEPPDAAPWNDDPTSFQVIPMPSLNQSEAGESSGTYVVFYIGDPVKRYWTKELYPGGIPDATYGNIAFNLTGVRIVRT